MDLAMVGPQILRLAFRTFVVVVGFLMLSGAINTSIVGSNGVLNRVSEDGVLTEGFRKPHKKYGGTLEPCPTVVSRKLQPDSTLPRQIARRPIRPLVLALLPAR